jgi:hypothetical protein
LQGEALARFLRARGVRFAPGLSEAEAAAAEKAYGLRFPPDLRALLKAGVMNGLPPFGGELAALGIPRMEGGFYDWRDLESEAIQDAVEAPVRGILEAVEAQRLWPRAWGERPPTYGAALKVAGAHLRAAPPLVPIYQQSYIPQEPREADNPVVSVNETRIRCLSRTLEEHLEWLLESSLKVPRSSPRTKAIPFWDDWIEYADAGPAASPPP